MRLAPLTLAAGLVLVATTACSDDASDSSAPPVTGTDETFCNQLRTTITDDSTIFDPLQPTSPAETRDATAELATAAPAAIAGSVRLLAEAFAQVADVLEQYDPSDPEARPAIEALDLDQGALSDAQQEVSDYATEACGIDLDAINAASVTTTTGVGSPPPTTARPPDTTVPATTEPAITAPPTTG